MRAAAAIHSTRPDERHALVLYICLYLRPRSIKCALTRCKHHICITEKSNNPTIIINSNANRVAHTMQFEICVNFQLVLHNKFICVVYTRTFDHSAQNATKTSRRLCCRHAVVLGQRKYTPVANNSIRTIIVYQSRGVAS